jgi:hypothetical protein
MLFQVMGPFPWGQQHALNGSTTITLQTNCNDSEVSSLCLIETEAREARDGINPIPDGGANARIPNSRREPMSRASGILISFQLSPSAYFHGN